MNAPAALEEIRNDQAGDAFPVDVLAGCETALVLFAAAWHGKQDAFWVAAAGLTATCVDNDAQRLLEMRHVYPVAWEFVTDDVFEYVDHADRKWDVVSVDCPSGAFGRCASLAADWCRIANRAVILGTGVTTQLEAPDGWQITGKHHRSNYDGGVFWSVLEPL